MSEKGKKRVRKRKKKHKKNTVFVIGKKEQKQSCQKKNYEKEMRYLKWFEKTMQEKNTAYKRTDRKNNWSQHEKKSCF